MSAVPRSTQADYYVADIKLADFGRKEISIAETEMPGLMAVREEYKGQQPLKGARIAGSLHMTIQTAVLIETLVALGAEVRWASCNIFSTQDHAAAAIAAAGIPVFAYKGESLDEYWEFTHRIFDWHDGGTAEHDSRRRRRRHAARLPRHAGREGPVAHRRNRPTRKRSRCSRRSASASKRKPGWYSKALASIKGVTEETTTGVHRLYQMEKEGRLPVPRDQRQRLGHQIEVRQSLRLPRITRRRHQARHRRDDRRQDRRRRGLWRRGQGLCAVAARPRRAVWITEIDPICALQAAMEGYRVVTMDEAADKGEIFVTATGNINVITHDHMMRMKHNAIVCNIGHFDSEIDIASLKQYKWENIKPQVDHVIFPSGKRLIVLAEGRLVNLGCGTGHPSFVMSSSFTNQVTRADRALTRTTAATRRRSTCCRSSSTRKWRACT